MYFFLHTVEYIVKFARYKLVILFIFIIIIGRTVALASDLVINSFLFAYVSNIIYLKLTYLYTPVICNLLSKLQQTPAVLRISLDEIEYILYDFPIQSVKEKLYINFKLGD